MGQSIKHTRTADQSTSQSDGINRRGFLSTTLAGLGSMALASGCSSEVKPASSALDLKKIAPPVVPSSEAPEVADLKVGIIALTDCSPLVVAAEKGFFAKYGLNVTVAKQASWAAIRDALSTGDIQATHMLLGMPLASTMGLLGSPKKPMVARWILNRNGQAITLEAGLKGKVAADPIALKPLVDAAKAAGAPMTFAVTFPPGTHAMWMRYYLGAGGINPDRDVALVTIPPPQMVANMKVGKMQGYCVGEPWNARAVADGIGFTAITTQEIWKDHPEKVCAFTEEFADKNPKTVKAVLKGLHDASVWLDDLKNRPEQCQIVSQANYINCPPEIILGRLQGKYDYGDGRTKQDPDYMIFHDRNCNYQFGRQSGLGLDQDAGYGTAGLGKKYPKHPWTPTVWFYYDYASGNFPGGDFNRFNPLFPLGHKYFGFIDAVNRSNIESPNVLLTMKPHKKWDFLMWYWYFMANSGSDIVPSLVGTPVQSTSRTHLGDELDMIAKYAISPRSNVLFGYSHFWRGNKILAPRDADFFYTQWEMNF